MRTLPPEPNVGDVVSAELIRELIRAIRARTLLQGPGVKISTGPNGTVVSAKASSSHASAADNGCYKILSFVKNEDDGSDGSSEEEEEESCTGTLTLGNCYYQIGGKTYVHTDGSAEAEGDDEEDGGEEGDDEEDGDEEGDEHTIECPCIVYLSIPADAEGEGPEISYCADMTELAAEQADLSKYVVPLYKFSGSGSVLCDFRNVPTAVMGEF